MGANIDVYSYSMYGAASGGERDGNNIVPLTPARHRGEDLRQVLEDWRLMVGARTVRVLSYPKNAQCQFGAQVRLAKRTCEVCVVRGDCPLEAGGKVLAEAGTGKSQLLFCLKHPFTSGDICVLQLGFSPSPSEIWSDSATYARFSVFARLSFPLLIWARSSLESGPHTPGPSLESSTPESPAELVEQQTEIYARELRLFFHEARELRRQLAEVEERSRAELRQAILAQDEEREWVALEVHDRIAQALAVVYQQLKEIEALSRPTPAVYQAAVRSCILCKEALHEARNIMNDLRPPILDELGLRPSMEVELQRLAEDTFCKVTQDLSIKARLPKEVELTLYRVFHEALVNIRRHARATEVNVSLKQEGDSVRLGIADNGIGFDVRHTLERKPVGGLLSMRRRTELAGGKWHLDSQPGKGTTISVWLPLDPPGSKMALKESNHGREDHKGAGSGRPSRRQGRNTEYAGQRARHMHSGGGI